MRLVRRLLLVTLGSAGAMFLLGGAVAQAATLYVSNVNPIGDGTSCAQPGYDDPQAAIDASADGDTVFLCAGTYPGDYDLDGSAATSDLYFTGEGEGVTIVDGGPTGDETNPRLFFDSNPGDIDTVHFRAMTLRDGYAVDGPGEDGGGGAIALWATGGGLSDVVASETELIGNYTEGSGGAIRAGSVTVTDSTFTGNRALLGDGAASDRGGAIKAEGTVEIDASTLTQNYALDQGGAIAAEAGVTVHTSNFESNESDWDGGAIFAPSGLVATSTEFTINTANDSGGGVWAAGVVCIDFFEFGCPAAPEGYSGVGTTFRDNVTEGNNGNGRGGGLYSASVLYMDNATLTGNSATDSDAGGTPPSPDGGGLFNNGTAVISNTTVTLNDADRFGGGIGSFGDLTLVETEVSQNSAPVNDGGGIWAGGTELEVVDSTISDNLAGSLGGGVFSDTSTLIDGSTLSGNESQNVGGGVFFVNTTEATVLDSTLTGNEAASGGGGILAETANITVDGSTFSANLSGSGGDWPGGGAIAGNQETTVTDSTFTDNRATGGASGGAIAAPDSDAGSQIEVYESVFSGNESTDAGGAIVSAQSTVDPSTPTVLVEDSTIADSDETPSVAGILALAGAVYAFNSTFTGLDSTCLPVALGYVLYFVNSTVTSNSGGTGGEACEGIEGALASTGLGLLIGNSTLADNSTSGLITVTDVLAPDPQYLVENSIIDHDGDACVFEGTTSGAGGNVVTDRTTGCDSLVGGPPPSLQAKVSVAELGLGPLADNGGPTETMAIGPDSAAVGAALIESEGLACPEVDQRGVERPENECDSGAFEYVTYDLTVTRGGSGSGTVVSDPAGVDCGSTCTYGFELDTEVTLTAEPDRGSRFGGWSGAGCSGTGPCQVTMSQARLVNANFFSPNAGVRISPVSRKTVRVRAGDRRVKIARVTCQRKTCVIKSARIVIRARGREFRVKAAFPTARFPAGTSRIVSATVPRAAFGRLRAGERSGSASALVAASSPDRTRAQRQVRIGLRR